MLILAFYIIFIIAMFFTTIKDYDNVAVDEMQDERIRYGY